MNETLNPFGTPPYKKKEIIKKNFVFSKNSLLGFDHVT
jgi:hypothetical protein